MNKSTKNMDDIARTDLKIIGFGNKFRSDDGFGPSVIEKLEKLEISRDKNIEILDCGTSGSDLLFHLKDCPRIIIIDALDAGQEEGSIACIKEKDIDSFLDRKISSLSLHDLNLSDIFKMARIMKLKSDITIIGIKPINTGFGDMLSPEISRKIPETISIILELI